MTGRFDRLRGILGSRPPTPPPNERPGEPPTIIVPVHHALDQTRACVQSILARTSSPYRLILIDDASPDDKTWPMLGQFASENSQVEAIRNETNQGYTRAINRGCEMAVGDVVLLNSDTRVTADWLECLAEAAYTAPNIATVTPLSNAAGAFSAPRNHEVNPLPEGVDEHRIAELVRELSPHLRPRVPTGNGFCMFITRDARRAVGEFDAESFPRGYGEENDFCMRAGKAGYINIIEDALYIFHERSASFGNAKNEIAAQSAIRLRELHPDYKQRVTEWLANDPLDEFRERLGKAISQLEPAPPKE